MTSSSSFGRILHIEDLSDKHYSCELVALVVKKWSGVDYCDIHVTDYTANKNLYSRRVNDGPDGRMTLKIEAHAPHKTFAERELQPGHVVHFKNLKMKWNRDHTELEGTLWADRIQPGRINITELSKNDPNVRAIKARQEEYNDPKATVKAGSDRDNRKKRKREAQKEVDRKERARMARIRDEAKEVVQAPNNEGVEEVVDESIQASSEARRTNPDAGEMAAPRRFPGVQEPPRLEGDPYEMYALHIDKARTYARQLLNGRVNQTELRAAKCMAEVLQMELLGAEANPAKNCAQGNEPYKLLPLATPNNKTLAEKVKKFFYHGSIAAKRSRPWLLTAEEKKLIQYPAGLEPRIAPHTKCEQSLSHRKLPSLKSITSDGQPADRELGGEYYQIRARVIDYFPEDLTEFVDSQTKTFRFWLRCTDGGRDDGNDGHATVAVCSQAAEQLLDIKADEMVDGGAGGIQRMRQKLNWMWGDLELLKRAYAHANPGHVGGRYWASQSKELWPTAPAIDLGVIPTEETDVWELCHTRLGE